MGTVPGLKRALRNVDVAALSRIGLPVLFPMVALVTLPSGLTETMMTPLPVALILRAS